MASGEGSQSFSPPRAASVASTRRLYHRGGLVLRRPPSTGLVIELADQLEGEVVDAVEGLRVDGVGDVVGEVVVRREEPIGLEGRDGRGGEGREARGQGGGGEPRREGPGAIPVSVIAVGGGYRLAELGEAAIEGEADGRALADVVADLALADGVEVDDVGGVALELGSVSANEGAHPLVDAFLAPHENDPDV